MAIVHVSSTSELISALASAKSGDNIKLAVGKYDNFYVHDLTFPGGVTISSVDISNPAELTGFTLRKVDGLTFSNLKMTDMSASSLYDFTIGSSTNIKFDHVVIKGIETDGVIDTAPVMIRNSSNVTISNSDVSHVRYGISMLDNNGVTLTGNTFSDIRTDGIRGGGNSNVTITNNKFTNFNPVAGDHPDAIQFWTANTTDSAVNITITGNIITRGDGAAMQGIFMGAELKLPYKNVVIEGNVVQGGMYNGIYVGAADGLSVTNNTVIGQGADKSWIRVNDVDVLKGNLAQTYIIDGINAASPVGNTVVGATAPVASAPAPQASMPGSATGTPAVPAEVTITGSDGADKLKAGKVGDFVLLGGAGNDTFTGGDGRTRMEGGAGDDVYTVNSSRDIVVEYANGGTDTVYTKVNYTLADHVETLRLSASDLTVHGNSLDNRILGSAGTDIMYGGGGADKLEGMAGDDIIYGEAGDDALTGDAGKDQLYGGAGNDNLAGDIGDDLLDSGAGDDWLEGGAGADILTGGAGKDMFNYRPADLVGRDTITDFSSVEGDRIGLSLIDANTKTAANDAFKFIGDAGFSKVAGQLRYTAVNDGVMVQGDTNGDAIADFSIFLRGVSHMSASDFIL